MGGEVSLGELAKALAEAPLIFLVATTVGDWSISPRRKG